MSNNIVNVNVNQIQAPTPNTLQRTGAFISQGATTLAAGTRQLLTQASDLTAILAGVKTLSTLTWTSSVVTATTTTPHGLTISDTITLTIAGCAPAGYNGTFLCTITGASTFTYPLVANPGTIVTSGSYTPEDVAELVAMNTTYFAQGSSIAVYVLELGIGGVSDGVTALTTWLNNNLLTVYRLLVPRTWSADTGYLALVATYQSTTARLYFHTTMTDSNYTLYTNLQKAVFGLIEAPGIPTIEFTSAAPFYWALVLNPSSTNKVAPFSFRYLFGVTPWPTVGNQAKFTAYKAAGVNYVGTGAEGGISNAILLWGTTMDVRPLNYWYAVDWTIINVDLNISNAVINGSNDPINPLYLNQDGINRLQAVGAGTLSSGVTFGMILGSVVQSELDGPSFGDALSSGKFAGQVVINAVPFPAYFTVSPSDYKTGTYNGFSVVMTPLRGFESITFNITVTDFVAP